MTKKMTKRRPKDDQKMTKKMTPERRRLTMNVTQGKLQMGGLVLLSSHLRHETKRGVLNLQVEVSKISRNIHNRCCIIVMTQQEEVSQNRQKILESLLKDRHNPANKGEKNPLTHFHLFFNDRYDPASRGEQNPARTYCCSETQKQQRKPAKNRCFALRKQLKRHVKHCYSDMREQ